MSSYAIVAAADRKILISLDFIKSSNIVVLRAKAKFSAVDITRLLSIDLLLISENSVFRLCVMKGQSWNLLIFPPVHRYIILQLDPTFYQV